MPPGNLIFSQKCINLTNSDVFVVNSNLHLEKYLTTRKSGRFNARRLVPFLKLWNIPRSTFYLPSSNENSLVALAAKTFTIKTMPSIRHVTFRDILGYVEFWKALDYSLLRRKGEFASLLERSCFLSSFIGT